MLLRGRPMCLSLTIDGRRLCRIQSTGDHERRRNRRHTRSTMNSLRLPHEASCFQLTSLSPTWSMSSSELRRTTFPQELSKDHRDKHSRRLDSLQEILYSQRETPSLKNRSLLQRYRSRRRNHALRCQV